MGKGLFHPMNLKSIPNYPTARAVRKCMKIALGKHTALVCSITGGSRDARPSATIQ